MRFIKDIKRYWPYVNYSAVCELKSEVASSYLNWLWWILDPLFFMLVYVFIALVVFRKSEPYFPVYVFLGLTLWYFFSKNITASVTLVKSNKNIVTKVYIPRFMLVLQKMLTNFIKMSISFVIIFFMMLVYKVPLSLNIFYCLPILFVVIVVTFGFSTIVLHFGVFVDDLSNLITVVLRLFMYLSGIFYNVRTSVPAPYYKVILYANPMAFCIDAIRDSVLYSKSPDLAILAIWLIIGALLSAIGVIMIYRYENTYAKVI